MIPLAVIGGIAVVWCCQRRHFVMAMVRRSLHYREDRTIQGKREREILKYDYENFG